MHISMSKIFENQTKVEYSFEAPIHLHSEEIPNVKRGIIIFYKNSEIYNFDEQHTDIVLLEDRRLKIKIVSKLIKIARSTDNFPENIDILYC